LEFRVKIFKFGSKYWLDMMDLQLLLFMF